ncbi:MAG: histidine phosphatase family protein [Candidatus Velthaea sp.]
MELVCVRHGRTAWNAQRRFQGRTDVPLDDEGRAQAQALAAHLAAERFDLALASDLSRAAATAAAIAEACGAIVVPEPRLREMRFGSWEGLTWSEIVARTPELAGQSPTAPSIYRPDDGESFDDVSERIRPVLAEVTARLGPGGRALLVSHAGVMHALLRVALEEPDEASLGVTFLPASIMRLSGDGSLPWRLDRVNEVAPPLAGSAAVMP